MALVLADRVRETSTSTGTGTIALAGAFPGFQSFTAGVGTGNTTYYTIANLALGEWEVGIGTYTDSGSTLSRTTVLSSSNSGALVNFSAGTKDVFVTQPAERAIYMDSATNVTLPAVTLTGTVAGGGNQINNVVIGASTPLAGSFTTLNAAGRLQVYNTSGADGGFRLSSTGDTSYWDFEVDDTSGLSIQQNNAARLAVSSTGLAVTGALSATGLLTLTGNSGSGQIRFTEAVSGKVGGIGVNATASQIISGSAAGDIDVWGDGTNINIAPGASRVGRFSSAGLAVTGALSASGDITASSRILMTTSTAPNAQGQTGWNLNGGVYIWPKAGAVNDFVLYRADGNAAISTDTTTGLAKVGFGLAVTGALSATGDATINSLTVGRGAGAVATNTAVGYQAGYSNTTGDFAAFGYNAARSQTTAVYNTAFGNQALYTNTGSGNTAFGSIVLYANTTGIENVGVGGSLATNPALRSNTTGSYNVSVGAGSLASNTTASNNTAVGYQAGYSNQTGGLTAFGYQALYSHTTGGTTNTAVGYQAAHATTTGSVDAFGTIALRLNTTGSGNAAFGNSNLSANTTGNYNAAFGGYRVLGSNTTGSNNVGIGAGALDSNTTASNNTAVGYQAGYSTTTGNESVYIGQNAGYSATVNGQNTFVGRFAGNPTTGQLNAFFGYGAGSAVTTGTKNTIIGRYDGNFGGLDIRTANNYIVLSDGDGNPRQIIDSAGNLGLGVVPSAWGFTGNFDLSNDVNIFAGTNALGVGINAYFSGGWKYKGTGAASFAKQIGGAHQWHTAPSGTAGAAISFTQAMTLDSAGNLLVGTTGTPGFVDSNSFSLDKVNGREFINHATGSSTGAGYVYFGYGPGGIGSITQSGTTAVLFNTTSDHRLKANQQPLTGSGAFIDALQPKSWEWTRDGRKDAGFIAHEFQSVAPNSVTGVKDETEEQEYEVSPAVPATQDAEGVELTPAEPAVMGTRTVPKYQAMQASSAEVIANLVAELQSLRLRVAQLEAA
jgi:hypothetical protein